MQLRDLATTAGQELTYTGAPPGSGERTGVDRDGDGVFDAADPGCAGGLTPDIENPQCDDGWDNDNDGAVDAADPNCVGPNGTVRNREKANACGLLGLEALLPLALALGRQRRRGTRATR